MHKGIFNLNVVHVFMHITIFGVIPCLHASAKKTISQLHGVQNEAARPQNHDNI